MTKQEHNKMTESEQRALNCADAIEDAHNKIKQCDELLNALETHCGKLIDKRFFEKHFTIKGEYQDYTKYSLTGKHYEWDKYMHRIGIDRMSWQYEPDANGVSIVRAYSDYEYIELQNRETAHVIAQVAWFKTKMKERIEYQTEKKAKFEAIDDGAIIADLQAIFFKYGEPDTWGKLLDSYEVKYPKK